jgi:hypothetical protein
LGHTIEHGSTGRSKLSTEGLKTKSLFLLISLTYALSRVFLWRHCNESVAFSFEAVERGFGNCGSNIYVASLVCFKCKVSSTHNLVPATDH